MAKQKGVFSLITGVVLGAAAAFLSSEKNREKTKKVIAQTAAKVKKAEAEYKKNPTAFKKKAVREGKRVVKSTVAKARRRVKAKLVSQA